MRSRIPTFRNIGGQNAHADDPELALRRAEHYAFEALCNALSGLAETPLSDKQELWRRRDRVAMIKAAWWANVRRLDASLPAEPAYRGAIASPAGRLNEAHSNSVRRSFPKLSPRLDATAGRSV